MLFRSAKVCRKHVELILEINKTVIVASRWFLFYLIYIDDSRSNTNQAGIFGRFSVIFLIYILRVLGSVLTTETSVWCSVVFLTLFRKILNFYLKNIEQLFLPHYSQSSIHHPLLRLYMSFAIISLINSQRNARDILSIRKNEYIFIF